SATPLFLRRDKHCKLSFPYPSTGQGNHPLPPKSGSRSPWSFAEFLSSRSVLPSNDSTVLPSVWDPDARSSIPRSDQATRALRIGTVSPVCSKRTRSFDLNKRHHDFFQAHASVTYGSFASVLKRKTIIAKNILIIFVQINGRKQ